MFVGDKVSHDAASEAYCLLTSYIREEGKLTADYNVERLQKFVTFLAGILENPDNFDNQDKTTKP